MSFTITTVPSGRHGTDFGWRLIRGGGAGGSLMVNTREILPLVQALIATHDQWIDEELLRRDLAREERGFPPPGDRDLCYVRHVPDMHAYPFWVYGSGYHTTLNGALRAASAVIRSQRGQA